MTTDFIPNTLSWGNFSAFDVTHVQSYPAEAYGQARTIRIIRTLQGIAKYITRYFEVVVEDLEYILSFIWFSDKKQNSFLEFVVRLQVGSACMKIFCSIVCVDD